LQNYRCSGLCSYYRSTPPSSSPRPHAPTPPTPPPTPPLSPPRRPAAPGVAQTAHPLNPSSPSLPPPFTPPPISPSPPPPLLHPFPKSRSLVQDLRFCQRRPDFRITTQALGSVLSAIPAQKRGGPYHRWDRPRSILPPHPYLHNFNGFDNQIY